MELFLLLPDLQSKNLFYKRFVITSEDSKNGFENRKWNYLNRKWNYLNRKWKYFSYSLTSDQKLLLQKVSNFYNGVQNWCWKEEMELSIQEMELCLLFPDH